MFTGIVQKLADITQAQTVAGGSRELRVATSFVDLESGESIAVNGVCLTVTEFDGAGNARFFVSPETLTKSNLAGLASGSRVNLERAVTLGTRLSGHLVQGHVDGMGKLVSVRPEADCFVTTFEIPPALTRYCVDKGSIALNGVSLTINTLDRATGRISITLIPHTWEHTQFSTIQPGDPINVEVDVMAKYVESLARPYAP